MPAFPTFAAGNELFWPCVTRRTYKNLSVENDVGYRYSYNERATPLMEWEVAGATIDDASLTTLRAFWATVNGGYDDFTFVDVDTSTTYTKCRFVGNDLTVRHAGPGENVVSFTIRELV